MSKARPARPWWLRWYALTFAVLLSLPIAALLGALALGFYKPFHVPSEAMEPTLKKGDRFIASFRGPGDLRRGDVIVFAMSNSIFKKPNVIYIKRIAALPGDRIAMVAGQVILNGRPVAQRLVGYEQAESFRGHTQARRLAEQFPGEAGPHHILDVELSMQDEYPETVVRQGHVFVLGDNRDKSADSRVSAEMMGVEQLPIERIRGKALFHGFGSSKGFGSHSPPELFGRVQRCRDLCVCTAMIDRILRAKTRMRPFAAAAAATLLLAPTTACDWMNKKQAPDAKTEKQLAAERREQIRKACASEATYGRLKELVFDEAARIRNSDPRNLDPLAASSVVRMEEPLVKSRDEDLNVTVCTGRFFLELPPGAENAFDGLRRLSAEVEYAAQAAADGSGMVYQMDGAEPIIYRLAAFGMGDRPMPKIVEVPQPSAPPGVPAGPVLVDAAPKTPPAAPPPIPKAKTAPAAPAQAAGGAQPSFNCRYAKTYTEKKVCASSALAAKDRAMASLYYDLMARSDPATRGHLRRSRDAFLARRERCSSEECIAAAYDARRAEIRQIAAGD